MSSAGSNVNIGLSMSKQNGLNYVDVASMGDFDASGVDSDEGSVAELEWNTWDDACAFKCRSASGNFPPDSDLGLPAGLPRDTGYYTEDGVFLAIHGQVGYVDGDIYLSRLCLWQQPGLWDIRVRNDDNVNVRGLNHRLTICWHMDVTDSPPLAVCYDCMCLISFIRTMMSLSYDGDGVFEWTGHDVGHDCSPAEKLGYLQRCLCSPWVMDRMTQYLTEINRPDSGLMLRKTMYAGSRRRVCTRG